MTIKKDEIQIAVYILDNLQYFERAAGPLIPFDFSPLNISHKRIHTILNKWDKRGWTDWGTSIWGSWLEVDKQEIIEWYVKQGVNFGEIK